MREYAVGLGFRLQDMRLSGGLSTFAQKVSTEVMNLGVRHLEPYSRRS